MQQAHPVIVTRIQNAASTPRNCHKNTKDNKPTLHTCNSAHQTMSKWKAQKFEKCQITTNLHKIIGICLFLLNLIHTYAHFYSNVCSQLTKYYVTIKLAEKHLLSQETFRQKIRCKISCFHLSFPSLSLFLADLTTRISWEVRSYSSAWALSWWRWWRWQWWQWWRCWW